LAGDHGDAYQIKTPALRRINGHSNRWIYELLWGALPPRNHETVPVTKLTAFRAALKSWDVVRFDEKAEWVKKHRRITKETLASLEATAQDVVRWVIGPRSRSCAATKPRSVS